MSSLRDVIVVGAGIMGSACAWWLARSGLAVDVFDPNPVGTGTTAAAMGHLAVMDDSEAQFELCRRSRELWDVHLPHLPASCEVDSAGALWVAKDDDELSQAERRCEFYRERDVKAQMVSASQLQTFEPNLRNDLRGALLIPQDSVLYPPGAARWLMASALKIGAKFHRGRGVKAIADGGVLTADGEILRASIVVNAAGLAAVDLMTSIDLGVELRSRKGHLAITDRVPGFCRRQILEMGYRKSAGDGEEDSVAFNIQPRRSGQVLIGSSRQFGAKTSAVELPILGRMLARAQEFMPRVGSLECIRVWTGFRAATPDGLPLIGAIPEAPGIMIAAGHEGLGITTALGTAELITNEILGRRSRINPDPYRPARFGGGRRERKRS